MKSKSVRAIWKCVLASVVATLTLMSSTQAADNYSVLHYFANDPAEQPSTALTADSAGNLYGTTLRSNPCGVNNCGTVFKLTREVGGKWAFSIIHRFNGSDGDAPSGSVIFDSSGNLYGTTFDGGAHNLGTVFELSPSGSNWKEKLLYSFGDSSDDVIFPSSALTWDARGNLYGTAVNGGYGGVFELKRVGNQWKERVIHRFTGNPDGEYPSSSLVADSAGNLYGTATWGGLYNQGVVYELTPSSDGRWTETVLYNFPGGVLGGNPFSGVILDAAGNLYGTTFGGGFYTCGNANCGTVFKLKRSGGNWRLRVLHSFDGTDGDAPYAGLTFDSAGNLCGTTTAGGQDGYGVVFKLSQSGNRWTETRLHSFDGKDGADPYGGLIDDQQGGLYGTTSGGIQNFGVVFRITP
jgi:uncharacterized repeat protein (TIGR03803 family)